MTPEGRKMLGLADLVNWLEYGKATGYKAARQDESQELEWATLLRQALIEMQTERTHRERLAAACLKVIQSLDLANDDPSGKTYAAYVLLRDALQRE